MTALLFFSGLGLLAMVEYAESANGGSLLSAQIDDDADGGGRSGGGANSAAGANSVGGMIASNVLSGYDSNSQLMDVLRSFRSYKRVPINILVLVSDGNSNTDSISVVHYDPNTYDVSMISIPRDTYVTVPGMSFHKVNAVYHAKSGGVDKLRDALEDILGQEIDYYAYLNLKTIREIVDLLDGITYTVPCDLKYDDPTQDLHINIKKGNHLLNGKQVEGLLRFRHPNSNGWTNEIRKYYDGGDLKRIERQKDFLKEALRQKLTLAYLPKINEVINNVYSNVKTDMPLSEVLILASGLPNFDAEKFQAEMLPGEADYIDKISYFLHHPKDTLEMAEMLLSDKPPAPPPVDQQSLS